MLNAALRAVALDLVEMLPEPEWSRTGTSWHHLISPEESVTVELHTTCGGGLSVCSVEPTGTTWFSPNQSGTTCSTVRRPATRDDVRNLYDRLNHWGLPLGVRP